MDQHPIPQDVTGFQFKLIGTMTVKQFGYVASGVIMAVILYYLPLHSAWGFLLKLALVPLFGASGVVIAFVPVDGRPIDIMTSNFVKALFSPNQYVYHRQGRVLSFETVSVIKVTPQTKTQSQQQPLTHAQTSQKQLDQKEAKLRALLLNAHGHGESAIDKRETAFLSSLTMSTTPSSPAIITNQQPQQKVAQISYVSQQRPQIAPILAKPPLQIHPPTPSSPENPTSREELSKKESELTQALSQAKQEELASKTPATRALAEQKMTLLSKQIQAIHLQKQLDSQKATLPLPTAQKPAATQQSIQDPHHVRVIPQGVTKTVGLPHISDSPNVVVGIVKDPRGNILPNILVEVKDKDDNPVRAFKTNQLGQFASATPLSPGTYTMILEDPKKQQRFDAVKIMPNNQIMPPIEIISHDAREELRKQLFAN
jgi:hypothetical protein